MTEWFGLTPVGANKFIPKLTTTTRCYMLQYTNTKNKQTNAQFQSLRVGQIANRIPESPLTRMWNGSNGNLGLELVPKRLNVSVVIARHLVSLLVRAHAVSTLLGVSFRSGLKTRAHCEANSVGSIQALWRKCHRVCLVCFHLLPVRPWISVAAQPAEWRTCIAKLC